MAHEPKTRLRYEAAGCLLGVVFTVVILFEWLLATGISVMLLIELFRRMQLSYLFAVVFAVLWVGIMGMALRVVVEQGTYLYQRILRRWFKD
jgi:hypothetical protein